MAAGAVLMVVLGSNHADAAFGRTKPVLNIVDAPIFTGSKETPALKDVEKAIRAAAVEERWVVTKIEDGHLQAPLIRKGRHYLLFGSIQHQIQRQRAAAV